MLFTIAIILLVLWILGFSVFHVAGALIHIVLVVAVVMFVVGLLRRGTA
ncbi:lmo0937 family membrane protein [Novosphingobium sp.]